MLLRCPNNIPDLATLLCTVYDCACTAQSEGTEEEADAEIDKVVAEITAGMLSGAVDTPTAKPQQQQQQEAAAAAAEQQGEQAEEPEADHREMHAMKARLESLTFRVILHQLQATVATAAAAGCTEDFKH
eukprot:3213-Heterococcus_DN1.PRE.3